MSVNNFAVIDNRLYHPMPYTWPYTLHALFLAMGLLGFLILTSPKSRAAKSLFTNEMSKANACDQFLPKLYKNQACTHFETS